MLEDDDDLAAEMIASHQRHSPSDIEDAGDSFYIALASLKTTPNSLYSAEFDTQIPNSEKQHQRPFLYGHPPTHLKQQTSNVISESNFISYVAYFQLMPISKDVVQFSLSFRESACVAFKFCICNALVSQSVIEALD